MRADAAIESVTEHSDTRCDTPVFHHISDPVRLTTIDRGRVFNNRFFELKTGPFRFTYLGLHPWALRE
jgi:hypothetical protein